MSSTETTAAGRCFAGSPARPAPSPHLGLRVAGASRAKEGAGLALTLDLRNPLADPLHELQATVVVADGKGRPLRVDTTTLPALGAQERRSASLRLPSAEAETARVQVQVVGRAVSICHGTAAVVWEQA